MKLNASYYNGIGAKGGHLLLPFLLLLPTAAAAFPCPLPECNYRWPSPSIVLTVRSADFPLVSTYFSAISAGAKTWDNDSVPGTTMDISVVSGNRSPLINFDHVSAIGLTYLPDPILATTTLITDSTNTSVYQEADIEFSTEVQFEPDASRVDFYPYDGYQNASLAGVMRHEMGHAIGLGGEVQIHEFNRIAVMQEAYSHGGYNLGLHADDRNGIRTLYPAAVTNEKDIAIHGWKLDAAGISAMPVSRVHLFNGVVGDTVVSRGSEIAIEYTVENLGSYGASVYLGFYIAPDSNVTSADRRIGEELVFLDATATGGNASYPVWTRTAHVEIPSDLTVGKYYVGAILDYRDDFYFESTEANNRVVFPYTEAPKPLYVTDSEPPPPNPGVPGAPQNVTASDIYCGFCEIRWDPPTSGGTVSGYIAYRIDNGDTVSVCGGGYEGGERVCDDGGSGPGWHRYIVRAEGIGASYGPGPPSDSTSGFIKTSPLPSPTNFQASEDSCGGIMLSWDWPIGFPEPTKFAISDNTHYPRPSIPQLPGSARSYYDQWIGMPRGDSTRYFMSGYTLPDLCGTPIIQAVGLKQGGLNGSPFNQSATADDCSGIRVFWEYSDSDAGKWSYEIYRDSTVGQAVVVGIPQTDTTWVDTEVEAGSTHTYYVRAVNTCGPSAMSAPAQGTRKGLPTGSFSSFSASEGGNCCEGIRLSWGGTVQGHESFRIVRDGVTLPQVIQYGALQFVDTDVTPGIGHTYAVQAVNSCGVGPTSSSDVGTRCSPVAWTSDGIPVSTAGGPSFALGIRAASDGAGGTVVVWSDKRNGTDYDIYAQRLNSDGNPCWTTNGVPVCVAPGDQTDPDVAEDGSGLAGEGGVVVVWMDSRRGTTNTDIYAQRIRLDGALEPTVYNGIVCGAPGTQTSPRVAKAPNAAEQGVIIVWDDDRTGERDIYGQRLLHSAVGMWPTQWDTLGIPICAATGFQWFPKIIPDGSGGAFVCWADERLGYGQSDIFGQRVDASGGLLWPASGVNLVQQCWQAGGGYPSFKIIPDGQGGALVATETLPSQDADSLDVRVQRVTSGGSVLWGSRGALAGGGQHWQFEPDIASDGAAGAVVVWRSRKPGGSDIYMQRLDVNGKPMWLPGGTRVSRDMGDEVAPEVVADGLGGWLTAWAQLDSAVIHIWSRRVTQDGAMEGSSLGHRVSTNPATQWLGLLNAEMAPGSPGTAVIAYEDWRSGDHADVYAAQVAPPPGGPDLALSYFSPEAGSLSSPLVGTNARQFFRYCPNNDGGASLYNHARIKIVVVDAAGIGIPGIAPEDIFVSLNGGTAAQGFYGSGADSIVANSQLIGASPQCPDLRFLTADAPTNASGVTYITFAGASATNPGVTLRNPGRKWGHYDSDLPVYVLGRRIQGRITSTASNGSYVLQIKNFDILNGLGADPSEERESFDYIDFNVILSGTPSFWKDLDWDGEVGYTEFNIINNHSMGSGLPHDCQRPLNP